MRLGMVSTYPPRRCGLAGYARDLGQAISGELGIVVCAVDRHGLNYPDEVVAVIRRDDAEDYRRAARILAEHAVDAVLIQHSSGIYGGPAGSHVLRMTHELKLRTIPYLVTLHALPGVTAAGLAGVPTVPPVPSAELEARRLEARRLEARTVAALTEGAAGVTVFTETARRLAVSARLCKAPITVVPYGVPALVVGSRDRSAVAGPPPQRKLAEALAAVRDCRVLATFGLIRPGKGLEAAIRALPKIAAQHPNVRYVIAGATDPDEASEHGDSYRESLRRLIDEVGARELVYDVDAFLTPAEVTALLCRADVYLAPRLSPDRSCSGTLTYAVAAGCPVVATDHPYARDMLADAGVGVGAGAVVPAGDVIAYAEAVAGLLSESTRPDAARNTAYATGSALAWPGVARRLAAVVRESVDRSAVSTGGAVTGELVLPELRLAQVGRLTDEIGVISSARGIRPTTRSGYAVADAARLAIVATGLLGQPPGVANPTVRSAATAWTTTALRLIRASIGSEGVRSRMSYSGVWLDEPHLDDHIGVVLWAAGVAADGSGVPPRLRERARAVREEAAALVTPTPGLAVDAYAILGLCRDPRPTPLGRAALAAAAGRLDGAWGRGDPHWRWFGDRLGPEAARLPQALIAAGCRLGDAGMVRRGLTSLDWYAGRVGFARVDGVLRCGGDEQSSDVGALVEAFVEAYAVTRARHYGRLAGRAFGWFVGANRLSASLYDADTGGCRDGVGMTSVSPNQGAPATLAYHQAVLALVEAGLAALPKPIPAVRELAAVP